MTLFERSPGVSDLSRLSANVPCSAAVWTSPQTQVWMWTSLTAASVAGPWLRPFVVTWRWSRIPEILLGQHQQLLATTGLSPPWTSPRSKVCAITWITQLHKSRKTTAFSQQPLLVNACVQWMAVAMGLSRPRGSCSLLSASAWSGTKSTASVQAWRTWATPASWTQLCSVSPTRLRSPTTCWHRSTPELVSVCLKMLF